MRNMDILHTINDVSCNPKDLFAMATCELRSYLAFPCDSEKGQLRVFDLDSCMEKYQIGAHRALLETFCFDEQATRLATSSIKGTVIRVFDAESGVKLHEFRRGIWQAMIYCLAFSSNGEYLACTSEHETVHVFKVLTNAQRGVMENCQGWLSSAGNLVTCATGLISVEVERYIREERSVITLQNPYHGIRTKVNISADTTAEKLRVQICGMNGFLSGFALEKTDLDWTCELQKAYFLTETMKKSKKIHQKP